MDIPAQFRPYSKRGGRLPLTVAHVVFFLGVLALLVVMACRKNVVVPAIIATLLTALMYSGDIGTAVMAVFRANTAAITALLELFAVIALVTAMLAALRSIGAHRRMVQPFSRLMAGGRMAFLVLFAVTYVLSLFFWPTPALALVGTLLLPAAVKAGLSPMGGAIAIAISGQGMALASDYVIGLAPSISASGAGVPAQGIADRALVISLIVGVVAGVLAYAITVRKDLRATVAAPEMSFLPDGAGSDRATVRTGSAGGSTGAPAPPPSAETGILDEDLPGYGAHSSVEEVDRPRLARAWAVATPLAFLSALVYMMLGRFTDLVPWSDGAGAPLVGGTAAILLVGITLTSRRTEGLETTATLFVDGLMFAFKAMGVIVPVAGFFYIGIPDFSGGILGLPDDAEPPAFLFDAVRGVQHLIPDSPVVIALAMMVIGLVIGLDGSGWAGLPLTGGLAASLAPASGMDTETLAAVAQNAATWTGGGTLVIWSSLVAVAGFAGVKVTDLVARLLFPVLTGLVVATLASVFLW